MPRLRYASLPSLGHVALAWAEQRGIALGTDDPAQAQRALEVALDAMPATLRPATCAWIAVRRNYCRATGIADPRSALRQTGFWARWLAMRGLAIGDRVDAARAEALRTDLTDEAAPFYGIPTAPTQRVWRRRGWAGMNNTAKALVLTTLTDGAVVLDVVATRQRAGMRARAKEKNRLAYQRLSRAERQALIATMRERRQAARAALGGRRELREFLREYSRKAPHR